MVILKVLLMTMGILITIDLWCNPFSDLRSHRNRLIKLFLLFLRYLALKNLETHIHIVEFIWFLQNVVFLSSEFILDLI